MKCVAQVLLSHEHSVGQGLLLCFILHPTLPDLQPASEKHLKKSEASHRGDVLDQDYTDLQEKLSGPLLQCLCFFHYSVGLFKTNNYAIKFLKIVIKVCVA